MNDNVISMNAPRTSEPETPMVSVYQVTLKNDDEPFTVLAELAVGTGALIFFRGSDNHVLRVIPMDEVGDVTLLDQVPEKRADA